MSSNLVYTPGPWEAGDLKCMRFPHVWIGPELPYRDGSGVGRAKIIVNEGPTPEDVAARRGDGTTLETCRANARLIAAAPDLLEALKVALEECRIHNYAYRHVTNTDRFELMEAAIAKAEGSVGREMGYIR